MPVLSSHHVVIDCIAGAFQVIDYVLFDPLLYSLCIVGSTPISRSQFVDEDGKSSGFVGIFDSLLQFVGRAIITPP